MVKALEPSQEHPQEGCCLVDSGFLALGGGPSQLWISSIHRMLHLKNTKAASCAVSPSLTALPLGIEQLLRHLRSKLLCFCSCHQLGVPALPPLSFVRLAESNHTRLWELLHFSGGLHLSPTYFQEKPPPSAKLDQEGHNQVY